MVHEGALRRCRCRCLLNFFLFSTSFNGKYAVSVAASLEMAIQNGWNIMLTRTQSYCRTPHSRSAINADP